MLSIARNLFWCAGLLACVCLAAPVAAQQTRIQFPSAVDPGASVAQTVPAFPSATYGSSVPPPAFDPYAAPNLAPPPPAFQQPAGAPGAGLPAPTRFLQQIRFEQTWLSRQTLSGLGIMDLELSASFAIPFGQNPSPFIVTPGFAVHYWDGPDSAVFTPTIQPDLPPRAYDAYLDVGWKPVINSWLSADLGVRVGVYSDFSYVDGHSIRYPFRGLGIATLSPTMQLAAGVVYIDRFQVKILPAGGLIWTPNPNSRYEVIFPRPKLSHRLTTLAQYNTDIWIYLVGEYGAGAWTITRATDVQNSVPGAHQRIDINDYRVNLGLDIRGPRGIKSWFEVGYVFGRQVYYVESANQSFNPGSTVLLRGGVAF